MAAERIKICRSNKCGFYDEKGTSEKAFLPGQETCGQCGCALKAKCASKDSYCSLKDIGQEPLWEVKDI